MQNRIDRLWGEHPKEMNIIGGIAVAIMFIGMFFLIGGLPN